MRDEYVLNLVGAVQADPNAQYTVWAGAITWGYGTPLEASSKILSEGPPPRYSSNKHTVAQSVAGRWHVLITAVMPKADSAAKIEQLEAMLAAVEENGRQWIDDGLLDYVTQAVAHAATELDLDGIEGLSWSQTFLERRDVHSIYATQPHKHGNADYKLSVPHEVNGKSVDVLLNIPGTLPPRTQLTATLSGLELGKSNLYAYQPIIELCIKDKCWKEKGEPGKLQVPPLKVRRDVLAKPAKVTVVVKLKKRRRKGNNCGEHLPYKCKWQKRPDIVDLDHGSKAIGFSVTHPANLRRKGKTKTKTLVGAGGTVTLTTHHLPKP